MAFGWRFRAHSATFMLDAAGPLMQLYAAAHIATNAGLPIAELVGVQNALPRGPRWRPLRLGIESLA
jgi:hypothetical protein